MTSWVKKTVWVGLFLIFCSAGLVAVQKFWKEVSPPLQETDEVEKTQQTEIFLSDLSETFHAGLSIGYTSDRVEQYMDKFSIKLVREPAGLSKRKLSAYFKKITLSETYENCSKEIEVLAKWVTKEFHKDYSPQILLFLARFCIEVNAGEKAIEYLEIVVQKSDSVWGSMGLCLQGMIYEDYMDKAELARQTYSRVLAHYPDSLEVTYANKALQRI